MNEHGKPTAIGLGVSAALMPMGCITGAILAFVWLTLVAALAGVVWLAITLAKIS